MLRRKSIQNIYKDYIFDIEELKFPKTSGKEVKIIPKKFGKVVDDDHITTTQLAFKTHQNQI